MSHVICFLFSLEMITACVFFICLVFFVSLIYLQTLRQQNTRPFRNFKHISVSFCFCLWDSPSRSSCSWGCSHGRLWSWVSLSRDSSSSSLVRPSSRIPCHLSWLAHSLWWNSHSHSFLRNNREVNKMGPCIYEKVFSLASYWLTCEQDIKFLVGNHSLS